MLIAVSVFALVLLAVIVPYWAFVVRPEEHSERALRKRLKEKHPRHKLLALRLIKAREGLSNLRGLDVVLERCGRLADPLRRLLERAGSNLNVGTIVLSCVFLAIVAAGGMFVLASSLPLALVAALMAASAPILSLRWKASKRLLAFEEQFPEAIDLMARALRAGHTLPTAMQTVGEEVPSPVGPEFRLLFDQQNFGMSLPDALSAFAERTPLLDAKFFVTAVLTQREMGGNLSEVLENLAAVIRERFKVKRHVRAVSAHGRITGWVLGFLPPVTAAILFLISPTHMRLLIDDPLGVYMVMGGLFLQFVGVLWIRRVVVVEY